MKKIKKLLALVLTFVLVLGSTGIKRKISGLILVLFMVITICTPVMASEFSDSTIGIIGITEVPVKEFNSQEEAIEFFKNYLESGHSTNGTYAASELTASVIRDGTSEDCEVYLMWSGSDIYNAWRYKQIILKHVSYFNSTVYATIGDGITYNTRSAVGAAIGSVKLADAKIDSDVESVKVSIKDLQGYRPSYSAWLSALEWSGNVRIN
jgi:hypothetical protein